MAIATTLKLLQARLAALDPLDAHSIDLIELSATNGPFLQFEPTPTFAAYWPEGTQLDTDDETLKAFIGAVNAARKLDARLQKRCDKLVPKKLVRLPLTAPPAARRAHARLHGAAGRGRLLARLLWHGARLAH